jgi:hypothetical protein
MVPAKRSAAWAAAGMLALAAYADGETAPTAARPFGNAAQAAIGRTRVNPDAALSAEFSRRVQEYLALYKKATSTVPELPKEATPEQIELHQRALAHAIQSLRPRPQVGEIFSKEIRAYFRRQLETVFSGPEGNKLKASIMDENPGPIKLRISGRYPDTVPLATMPPQVLAALPKLPPELEYRFIGDRLILLDVSAHLIVDFIEDALPR